MSYWMAVRRRLMIAALARIDVAALAIAYTGAMTDQIVTMGDGKQYRLLTLTSSGTLSVEKPVQADVWMCGGGANGNPAWTGGSAGGCGGSGGFIAQVVQQKIKNIIAAVGAAAGASSISGDASLSASGALSPSVYSLDASKVYGATGGGGRGAYTYDNDVAGLKGTGFTTYPFGDTTFFSGKPHCAGGGGGTYSESSYGGDDYGSDGGNGGTNGGNGYSGYKYEWGHSRPGAGGLFGGGKGSNGVGANAATNASFYGSGGGGGATHERDEEGDVFDYTYPPSAGYQGVIYVRIPLDQKAA